MYIAKRGAVAFGVLLVAVCLNFVLIRAAPGNYADYLISQQRTTGGALNAEEVAAIRRQYGLDQPIQVQFADYLLSLAKGNLGTSFVDKRPVTSMIWEAAKNSLPMLTAGLLIGSLLGVAIGVMAAAFHGRWVDILISGLATVLYSLPAQWLGILLLFTFAGVLPIGGRDDPFLLNPSFGDQALDLARHMLLPSLTLGLLTCGGYALIVRSAMLEQMGDDFVLTARAKGYSNARILVREVLRNASLPIATLAALSLGAVFGGAILIEVVFSWPGVGLLAKQAVASRDYPVVQGTFLVLTIAIVACNFLADLVYSRLDPRVRT